MTLYTLHRTQKVAKPLEEVFAFFQQPENLAVITPASLGFKILTPSPILMEKGRIIDYQIKVGGVPCRWKSMISEYQPPRVFVDEQLSGPYSFWHHTHRFRQEGSDTVIEDEVRYMLPMGFFGEVAHRLFVKNQLQKIFDFRQRFIEDYFKRQ